MLQIEIANPLVVGGPNIASDRLIPTDSRPRIDMWLRDPMVQQNRTASRLMRPVDRGRAFRAGLPLEFSADQQLAFTMPVSRARTNMWMISNEFFNFDFPEQPPSTLRSIYFGTSAFQAIIPMQDLALPNPAVGFMQVNGPTRSFIALPDGIEQEFPGPDDNIMPDEPIETGYGDIPPDMFIDARIKSLTVMVTRDALIAGMPSANAKLRAVGSIKSLLAPGVPILTIPTHMRFEAQIKLTPANSVTGRKLLNVSLSDFKLRPQNSTRFSLSHAATVAILKPAIRKKVEEAVEDIETDLNGVIADRLDNLNLPGLFPQAPGNRRTAWHLRTVRSIMVGGVPGLFMEITGLWFDRREDSPLRIDAEVEFNDTPGRNRRRRR